MTYERMAEVLVRIGWPKSIGKNPRIAHTQIDGYCKTLLSTEIKTVDGVRRDEHTMILILKSLSRHVSTSVADTKIASDIEQHDGTSIHINTVKDYINALRKLHVLDELPAWSPKLRSKATIRTSDTRHFCDPDWRHTSLVHLPQTL